MNYLIISILEILAVSFTVWALFNEKKLIRLEHRFIRWFRSIAKRK
jgi:hypothetical protein